MVSSWNCWARHPRLGLGPLSLYFLALGTASTSATQALARPHPGPEYQTLLSAEDHQMTCMHGTVKELLSTSLF